MASSSETSMSWRLPVGLVAQAISSSAQSMALKYGFFIYLALGQVGVFDLACRAERWKDLMFPWEISPLARSGFWDISYLHFVEKHKVAGDECQD